MNREGMATVFKSQKDLLNALASITKLEKGGFIETDLGTCVFLGISRDIMTDQVTYEGYHTREVFDKSGNVYHVPNHFKCSLGAILASQIGATQLSPDQLIDLEDGEPTESEQ